MYITYKFLLFFQNPKTCQRQGAEEDKAAAVYSSGSDIKLDEPARREQPVHVKKREGSLRFLHQVQGTSFQGLPNRRTKRRYEVHYKLLLSIQVDQNSSYLQRGTH